MVRRIHGPADVAEALGVSKAAIANAVKRDGNGTPAPAYVTGQGRTFWDERGMAAWRAWQESSRRSAGQRRVKNED